MQNSQQTCTACSADKTKGYVYALITAIVCPCHLPLVGIFLGTSAAGVLFQRHFMLLATVMGILSLYAFMRAARILL